MSMDHHWWNKRFRKMKSFAYKVIDEKGQTIEGEIELNSIEELNKFFLQKALIPLKIKEKSNFWDTISDKVPLLFNRKLFDNELIAFTRQFGAAYSSGLSVPRALRLLSEQLTHSILKRALKNISSQIEQGKGLTESFRRYPKLFDNTYLAILNTGELTGNLDSMLNYSANLLEKKLLNKERLKSAFLYPKLVLGMIVITVIVLLIFVIPQFAKLFDRFGATLPPATLALITIAQTVKNYWWVFLVAFVAAFYLLIPYLKNNESFMIWLGERLLKLPILGVLLTKIEINHFCVTFALLLKAGIKVTDAAVAAIDGIKNSYLKKMMSSIKPHLEQGGTISGALEKITVIPPVMVSMIAVGEESGSIEALLEKLSALYDNEIDLILKRLPTLLEPIILAFLFLLVLGLAIAVYGPLWKLSSVVRGGG